jgi:hypothetical protein
LSRSDRCFLKLETGNLEGDSKLCTRSRNIRNNKYFFGLLMARSLGRGSRKASFKFHSANR